MRVDDLQLERAGDRAVLSARATGGPPGWPQRLWFDVPAAAAPPGWEPRADPFAAALLLPAMAHGQALEIADGPVSPRLLLGLNELRDIFAFWYPGQFQRVALSPADARPVPPPAVRLPVACAVSGGVDSLYYLHRRLVRRGSPPLTRPTVGIFVDGFATPERETGDPGPRIARLADDLAPLGLGVVTVRTNVRRFLHAHDWRITHGAALASVALAMQGMIGRMDFASSFAFQFHRPWGTGTWIDYLWGTERCRVRSADPGPTRADKLARLADWPVARRHLQVCTESAETNCGRCIKCQYTRMYLRAMGEGDAFERMQFPLLPSVILSGYPVGSRGLKQQVRLSLRWAVLNGEWTAAAAAAGLLTLNQGRANANWLVHGVANRVRSLVANGRGASPQGRRHARP